MAERVWRGLSVKLLILGVLGLAMACTNEEGAKVADNSTVAKKGGDCAEYGERLCKEVAPETCASIKTVVKILPEASCQAGLTDFQSSLSRIASLRARCDELIDKLCKDIGPDSQTCDMVRQQTTKFPADRCDMMLESYDEVLAELRKREEQNKPLSKENQIAIAGGDVPAHGPKNAVVTLVEFSDFECPYCARAAEVMNKVKDNYADKVRVVFRQFPLSFHKNASVASQAALAAHAQGKFWEFHDVLFANQSKLDRKSLEGYGKKIGLKMKGFVAALDGELYKKAVDADLKLGELASVSGTPSMFVNGQRVLNPMDYDALTKMIDRELSGK